MPAEEIADLLETATEHAVQLVPDYGTRYSFDVRITRPQEPHPFGQANVRLVGLAPSRAPVTIKVEITGCDEPILLPTTERAVLHSFPDESLSASIRCYSLEEVATEKIRAGLQQRDRLNRSELQGKRGYANRVRDIYDLWFLRTSEEANVDWALVKKILPEKTKARNTRWNSVDDFRDAGVEHLYKEQWSQRLQAFVGELPPFTEAWDAYSMLLDEVDVVPIDG
jgi:predicted nucleotidyltransferase component of viral defense system